MNKQNADAVMADNNDQDGVDDDMMVQQGLSDEQVHALFQDLQKAQDDFMAAADAYNDVTKETTDLCDKIFGLREMAMRQAMPGAPVRIAIFCCLDFLYSCNSHGVQLTILPFSFFAHHSSIGTNRGALDPNGTRVGR